MVKVAPASTPLHTAVTTVPSLAGSGETEHVPMVGKTVSMPAMIVVVGESSPGFKA